MDMKRDDINGVQKAFLARMGKVESGGERRGGVAKRGIFGRLVSLKPNGGEKGERSRQMGCLKSRKRKRLVNGIRKKDKLSLQQYVRPRPGRSNHEK